MSFIFSKENRILFNENRENSDSLLELTYNNRLIPLRNIITTKVKKENKAFFKLSSKIFFDTYKPKKNLSDQFANDSFQQVIEKIAYKATSELTSPILDSRRYNDALKFKSESRLSDPSSNDLLKINNHLFSDPYTVIRWLSIDHILKNAIQRFIISCLFSIAGASSQRCKQEFATQTLALQKFAPQTLALQKFAPQTNSLEENKTLQSALVSEKDQYLNNIFSILQSEDTFLKLSDNTALFQVNPKMSLTSYQIRDDRAEVFLLDKKAMAKRSFALNEVLMRFSKNYHSKIKEDPSFSKKKESTIFLKKNTAATIKGELINLQNPEYKAKNRIAYKATKVGAFLNNLIFKNHFYTRQKLVPRLLTFKEKVNSIKKRVPQVNKWNFAFGSSFLLIIMISILERQELSIWYFSFFKRQMPGLYTFYEEASWESFENIISKYLIKNSSISLSDVSHSRDSNAYKSFKHRAYLLKKLDLQKDILLLDLSKVWDLQLKKDFIGVFPVSKDFRTQSRMHQQEIGSDNATQRIASRTTRIPSKVSPWFARQTLAEQGKATSFESTRSDSLHDNSHTSKLAICKKVPRLQRPFLESFYKMNARIPCHHLVNGPKTNQNLPFSVKNFCFLKPNIFKSPIKGRFGLQSKLSQSEGLQSKLSQSEALPRFTTVSFTNQSNPKNNVFKERVFCENNSIPLKMSSSVTTVFSNNYKIRSQIPSILKRSVFETFRKQEYFLKKNIAFGTSEKKNDILKKFFYEYGFFYIPTQALSTPSPEEDFLKTSELKVQLQETISSQLYNYVKKNFKEVSAKYKSFCFENFATLSSKAHIPENTTYLARRKRDRRERDRRERDRREHDGASSQRCEREFVTQTFADGLDKKLVGLPRLARVCYANESKLSQSEANPIRFVRLASPLAMRPKRIALPHVVKHQKAHALLMHPFRDASKVDECDIDHKTPSFFLQSIALAPIVSNENYNHSPLYIFPITQTNNNPQLLTAPIEKISCYTLRKTDELKPRLLSGYKSAEIKTFEQSRAYKSLISRQSHSRRMKKSFNKKVLIKIPPTLPCFSREFFSKFKCCIPPFSKSDKEAGKIYNKAFINKEDRIRDERSKATVCAANSRWCIAKEMQARREVKPFKKIPYKQLALNEFQEIKSLFEKISKENRISPHNLTFKNPFFTDYNNYLNTPKDSPGAIAISPSLEEDQSIQQAWVEYIEKQRSVNQTLEKRKQSFENNNFGESSKEKDTYTKNLSSNEKKLSDSRREKAELKKSSLLSPSLSSLPENDTLSQHKQESTNSKVPFSGKDPSSSSIDRDSNLVRNQVFLESQNEDDKNSGAEIDEEKELNEEEKKKEITKWEWLHSVRESELTVEKRKEFQKVAYPNKEALFTNRIRDERLKGRTALKTPVFRNLQNFFVSDRKFSFFGMTDLFPKRLIAEDQRQINNQILRKDYDQRSARFFISSNKKKSDIKQDFSQFSRREGDHREGDRREGDRREGDRREGDKKNHPSIDFSELFFLERTDFKENSNQKKKKISKNKLLEKENSSKTFVNTLQITPRLLYEKAPKVYLQPSKSCYQHPIYTPNRRLRLRIADLSKSAQNNNPQARVDYLNSCQSDRWWQKRRVASSLLGAPSKRYMVMPEITQIEWRKIIEWQLKTYFLEEEKRLQPLIVSKGAFKKAPDSGLSHQVVANNFSRPQEIRSENSFISKFSPQEIIFDQEKSRDLKIKKIAIYLPWVTLKKTLKKPFEWPLTRLSYQSLASTYKGAHIGVPDKARHQLYKESIDPQTCVIGNSYFVEDENKVEERILFSKNRKPDFCLISSLSPNRQALPFTFTIDNDKIGKIKRDKHFIFEMISKDSHLLFHQLLLAVAIKQIFQTIYYLFGKMITDKIKNSSFSIALLPLFFNAYSHKNQISGVYNLNKRLKDLVGSEDSISSLSELVWYLRNSCRGRIVPRGVVLLETEDSESTEFLKAVGGEAQVPVIVESLRALLFTQNHPQRRLEKILKFAEKSAPCILFLDDLDAIGKERSFLINENGDTDSSSMRSTSIDTQSLQKQKGNRNTFLSSNKSLNFLQNAGGIKIANEKEKWKVYKNDLIAANNLDIGKSIGLTSVTKQSYGKRHFLRGEIKKTSNHSRYEYARPIFGRYNMLLKTLLFQKTKSQEAHTFLLNSFRASNKSSKGASLTGAYTSLNGNKSSSVEPETERLMEQRRLDLMLRLLTVMDGISHLKGVLIVTTSKNPSSLDPALLRPGRFERFIHLKLPNKKRRIQLLKVQTSKIGHINPMPWEYFGKEIKNLSGTSISNAINHSAFQAIIQSTAHTPTTLEYGINRVKGVKTSRVYESKVLASFVESLKPRRFTSQVDRFSDANEVKRRALYAPARYQAGKGILQSLFDSNKQKESLNLKFSDFIENFVKLHGGRASEALYLASKRRTSENTYQFLQLNQSYLEQLETVFSIGSILNEQTKFQFLSTRYNFDPKSRTSMVHSQDDALARQTFALREFALQTKTDRICLPCLHPFRDALARHKLYTHRTSKVRQQKQMSLSFQFLVINKDYLFEEKICETLKTFKKPPGNWYRLYLPELSDSKSNREWRIPDRFFNQSLSLLNIKSIFQNVNQRVLKNSDLSYYNVVSSSFYISFQSLNENRELLDLFADHLIRFKSLRTHEIMRISLFYINVSSLRASL